MFPTSSPYLDQWYLHYICYKSKLVAKISFIKIYFYYIIKTQTVWLQLSIVQYLSVAQKKTLHAIRFHFVICIGEAFGIKY